MGVNLGTVGRGGIQGALESVSAGVQSPGFPVYARLEARGSPCDLVSGLVNVLLYHGGRGSRGGLVRGCLYGLAGGLCGLSDGVSDVEAFLAVVEGTGEV